MERSAMQRFTRMKMGPLIGLTLSMAMAGCGGNIKFERTAEELLEAMERDGPVVPVPEALAPSTIDRAATLSDFAVAAARMSQRTAFSRRLMLAAEARVEEAVREFYPQVALTAEQVRTEQSILESSNSSLEGDASRYDTVNVTATARLRLMDLQRSAAVVAARSEAAARTADLEAAEQDVLDDVVSAYVDAGEALERWRLAQAEVQFYSARAEFEERQEVAGELRGSERSVAAAELARARSDAEIAAADFRIRTDRMCSLGFDTTCPYPAAASTSVALPRPEPITQNELDGIENAPEIRAMADRVNVALREVDQARMAMYPRLTLELAVAQRDRGGSLFDGSSVSQTQDVSLEFEWDIYTSGRLRRIRDAELNEALAAGHDYEARLQTAVSDMRSATSALGALWQHDRSLNQVIALRRTALQEIERERDAGVLSDLDVEQARLDLVRAEVFQQRTRRNYIIATVARARAQGALDQDVLTAVERVLSDNRFSVGVYGRVAPETVALDGEP